MHIAKIIKKKAEEQINVKTSENGNQNIKATKTVVSKTCIRNICIEAPPHATGPNQSHKFSKIVRRSDSSMYRTMGA